MYRSFTLLLSVILLALFSPTVRAADTTVAQLITPAEWDVLFPHRFNPDDRTGAGTLPVPAKDFFSYNNFILAVQRMSNIKAIFERRCATNYYRITRIDKTTGASVVIRDDAPFHDPQWSSRTIVREVVDYGSFANEGDVAARKRELLAFLANISQETTGGWPTAPGGQYAWGLYFREEQGYEGTNNIGYRDETSTLYPPAPGKSYHGRGPIQLSYNYNYGQASELLYGDKNILLANPEKVIQDGALAFQTGLWFWMAPQYPKLNCHDVMIPGKWTPTALQQASGLKPGFGATVVIINGGIECGSGQENTKVLNRIGHFQRYTGIKGVSMELNGGNNPANCGCANMKAFAIDNGECGLITGITFSQPANNVITLTSLTPVTLKVSRNDPRNEISRIYISINGQRYNDSIVQWTPPGYQAYTATGVALRNGQDSLTVSNSFIVWNNVTFAGCKNLPAWQARDYTSAGNVVLHNSRIYRNKWWAGAGSVPGSNDTWELLGNCTNDTVVNPTCNGIPAWLDSKAYVGNDQVSYKNKVYKANWWNQNTPPDVNSGAGKPWTYVRDCAGAQRLRDEEVNVYPNPLGSNTLYLSLPPMEHSDVQIELLNSRTRQPILQQRYQPGIKTAGNLSLNVSNVPSGTFILRISDQRGNTLYSTPVIRIR